MPRHVKSSQLSTSRHCERAASVDSNCSGFSHVGMQCREAVSSCKYIALGSRSHLDCKSERVCLEVRLDGFADLLHKQPAAMCLPLEKLGAWQSGNSTHQILPEIRHLLCGQIFEALYYSVRADKDVPGHDWLDVHKCKGEPGFSKRLGVVYGERSKLSSLQHPSS